MRLVTESYNKLKPPNTGPFKEIKFSPSIITIDEDWIQGTVSIDPATLAPLVKFAERLTVYMSNEPVDKRGDEVDEARGQTTIDEFVDTPLEYTVDRIVRHVGERDSHWYVVHWYDYTPADDTVEQPRQSLNNSLLSIGAK